MSVPIGVVAHPSRMTMANRLAEQVSAEAVSWDVMDQGCEATHLRLWGYLAESPSPYVVILEDDAQPCEHFRDQLGKVLSHAPSPIVSLYLGRGRPDQWQLPISSIIATEACFITSDTLLSTVGYAVRTELLPLMLHSVPLSVDRLELPEAITRWAKRRKHTISYARPSIVQHRDVPPVIATEDRHDGQERTELRQAWLFGERRSWDSSAVELPHPDLRRHDKVARHLVVVQRP